MRSIAVNYNCANVIISKSVGSRTSEFLSRLSASSLKNAESKNSLLSENVSTRSSCRVIARNATRDSAGTGYNAVEKTFVKRKVVCATLFEAAISITSHCFYRRFNLRYANVSHLQIQGRYLCNVEEHTSPRIFEENVKGDESL